jgi:nucleoside-diphosphate-sugar epimerase
VARQIFITGASGFVGGAIARALTHHHIVRAMSRSPESDRRLASMRVAAVRCELGQVAADHLVGCDTVIHCAAYVKQWGSEQVFRKTNIDGTRQLLETASRAGVQRFIHIGTEAALFHGQDMLDVDERYPYPAQTPFLYSATKAAAERLVLAANTERFTTLSLRPRLVWGPGDQTVLPVIVAAVRSGRFAWIDDGKARTSTTHIDNLVHAVTLALHRGQGGNAYFVTDQGHTSVREFFKALLHTQGIAAPNRSIPGVLAYAIATATEAIWRTLRLTTEPPLTRFATALLTRDCTLRIDKAQCELGFAPIVTRAAGLQSLREGTRG